MKEYTVKVYDDGEVRWYLNGNLHREDGPALTYGDYQAWWLNGKRHREDGPAIIDGDYHSWWLNGKRHREDGLAVIDGDYQAWWLNGVEYTEDEFNKKINPVKELTVEQISNLLGYEVKIVK